MPEPEKDIDISDKIIALIRNMSKNDLTELLISIVQVLPDEEQVILLKDLMSRCLKRGNTRHPVFNKIDFSYRGKSYPGIIQDISTTGLFIETNQEFIKGREIIMKIPFHKSAKEILVRGEIIRITPHGIGVNFSK